MNDTHRSTPAFSSFIAASRDAFRMPALPERVGELTGEVRDALNTQTTDQNSVEGSKSADRFRDLVERIANWTDDELQHVDAWQTRYIARAVRDGATPTYPPFPAEQTNESEKSGAGAAIGENRGDHAPEVENDAVRAAIADAIETGVMTGMRSVTEAMFGAGDADAGTPPAFDGIGQIGEAREAAHYAAVGELKEEGEDDGSYPFWPERTPEQQAATFQAITDEPRPSAVAIKAALERGDEIIAKLLRIAPDNPSVLPYWPGSAECATIGFDLRAMLGMLDRLGIHCLALEIERDDLTGQLDRIAAQAKPVDGTDLAELVQKAREASGYIGRGGLWHGSSGTMHGRSIGGAETANMIDRLVAAVNDQARRLREAETVEDPDNAELLSKSGALVVKFVMGETSFDAGELFSAISRLRWALIQEDKARRTYTDDQRDQAIAKFANDPAAQWYTEERSARIVDLVAEALGMTRAK